MNYGNWEDRRKPGLGGSGFLLAVAPYGTTSRTLPDIYIFFPAQKFNLGFRWGTESTLLQKVWARGDVNYLWYNVLRWVSDFSDIFHRYPDWLETYASTFLTAKLTYWDDTKAQALMPFSSLTCLVDPPRCILGCPIDFPWVQGNGLGPCVVPDRNSHWWLVRCQYIGE